jgi:hypothetical protein
MLESLEITEEDDDYLGHPRTEEKHPHTDSLMRRFEMCFNEVEKSEIISILTSHQGIMIQGMKDRKSSAMMARS